MGNAEGAGINDQSNVDFTAPAADAASADSALDSQNVPEPDAEGPLADIFPHDAPAIDASTDDSAQVSEPPAEPAAGQEPEADATPLDARLAAEPELDADSPQDPTPESAPADEPVVEARNMPLSGDALKAEIDSRIAQAVGILKEKKAAGVFAADPNKIAMADLGIAIEQSAGQMPENYHALMQAISELAQAAQDPAEVEMLGNLHGELSRNTRVLFEGRMYLLSNLIIESKSSGPESIAARAINRGEYKITYDFDRSVLTNEVSNEVAVLERTVKRLGKRPEAEAYQKQLDVLRLAQRAQGEGGGVVAVRALEMVIDPRNPKDPIRQLLDVHGEAVVARSRAAIETQLRSANYSEVDIQSIWELARAGDWEGLAETKDLQNSGLETTIFGKNAEKVVKDLMGPGIFEKYGKKYGKGGILAIALILFSGLGEFKNALQQG